MATPATAKVLAEALALTAAERRELVNDLLMSIEPPAESPEWKARLKADLERRWHEVQSGELGDPFDEAIADIRGELDAMES